MNEWLAGLDGKTKQHEEEEEAEEVEKQRLLRRRRPNLHGTNHLLIFGEKVHYSYVNLWLNEIA